MRLEHFFESFEVIAEAPGGVAQLKAMVLRLAVQGRLHNHPRDNTNGSRTETLGNLVSFQNGYAFKSNWYDEEGVRVVRNQNVSHGFLDWVDEKRVASRYADEFSRFALQQGDIVLSLDRPIISTGLKVARIRSNDLPCLLLQRVARLQIKDSSILTPGFLFLWLCSPDFTAAIDPGRSKGVPHISTGQVERMSIKIPALSEQRRIVAKVDELMALCDELEARKEQRRAVCVKANTASLDALANTQDPEEFERCWKRVVENWDFIAHAAGDSATLRRLVVDLAVTGRLSVWEPVPGKVDDVFRCIEKERQTTARTPREFVPLSSLLGEPEGERTIPSHWSWAYFGDVHLGITSGWSPQCEDRQREGDEWGVLKVSAVSWNRFLPEQNKALPANLEPRPQHEVRVGDFLMSRANTADLVGKSIVVHDTPPHLMLSDKLLRVTLPRSYLPKFANLVNNSSLGRGHYETEASGTSASMKNISREQINRLVVPIAPLEEQRRIVTKVDHLMALCNELERAITKKGATSERYASAAVLAMMNEEGRRDRT